MNERDERNQTTSYSHEGEGSWGPFPGNTGIYLCLLLLVCFAVITIIYQIFMSWIGLLVLLFPVFFTVGVFKLVKDQPKNNAIDFFLTLSFGLSKGWMIERDKQKPFWKV